MGERRREKQRETLTPLRISKVTAPVTFGFSEPNGVMLLSVSRYFCYFRNSTVFSA